MNTEEMNVLSGADLTDAEDGSSLWQDAWLRLKKSFSMAKQIVSTVVQASIEKISL